MSKIDQEQRDELPGKGFAFPKQRKEPLDDASHVRNAIARFNQVRDVTDEERDEAWKRIREAARKFKVEMGETDWRELKEGGKDGH
jgi:cell division protein FtsX